MAVDSGGNVHTSGQARPAGDAWVRRLIVALLFLAPALVPIRADAPVRDPDVWWHLATGRWIAAHGALPVVDPFGPDPERTWIAYSWLYELTIYRLYEVFGLAGLYFYAIAASLAITAAVYAMFRRLEPRFVVAVGLAALVVASTWRHQGARTFLITILFFAIELDVLMTVRRTGRNVLLLLLPLLFALWANLHIQFVYGLALLGLMTAESILAGTRLGLRMDESDVPSPAWLIPVTLVCLVATWATPYGWRLYVVVYEYATQGAAWLYLPELRAPTFRAPQDWIVLALVLAAAFALGRRHERRFFLYATLAFAVVLSFMAMRDSWIAAIVAAGVLAASPIAGARMRPHWGDTPRVRAGMSLVPGFVSDVRVAHGRGLRGASAPAEVRLPEPRLGLRGSIVAGALVAAAIIAALAAQGGTDDDRLRAVVARHFPAAAADFVERQAYPGPLFNHFDWGGYLAWRLPQYRVSIDGRTNVYGDQALHQADLTWSGLPGWDADPQLLAARVVIAPRRQALTTLLRLDPRFSVAYEDELAVVFVREDAPGDGETRAIAPRKIYGRR